MERVVIGIVARHDPADDFTAGSSEKERRVAVLIKRVFPAKKLFALDDERRHPGRIVFVNSPGKLDERVPVHTGFDLGDF